MVHHFFFRGGGGGGGLGRPPPGGGLYPSVNGLFAGFFLSLLISSLLLFY